MKTLNLYVTKNLLFIIFVAIGILTFGMLGGNLLQVFKFVSHGIPIDSAFKFLLYIIPMAFSFTIPWGILIAVLLLFGRMSADNEITAMKACGISIFQIISPLVILTFFLTIVCLWLQTTMAPHYMGLARALVKQVGFNNPAVLLNPGQPNDLGHLVVYVGDKKGNDLKDIQVFIFNADRTDVDQDITAARGKMITDKEQGTISIQLYDYNVINYNGNSPQDRIYGKELTISVDVERDLNKLPLVKRVDFSTYNELMGRISLYKKAGIDTTACEVQLNLMFAMGLSPIAFLLLGFPLAIRTSRKETSVGLFIAVILSAVYFGFIIGCDSLADYPQYYPQYLLWIPNILYQVGGLLTLWKITKR